jgi:hypothetical protein
MQYQLTFTIYILFGTVQNNTIFVTLYVSKMIPLLSHHYWTPYFDNNWDYYQFLPNPLQFTIRCSTIWHCSLEHRHREWMDSATWWQDLVATSYWRDTNFRLHKEPVIYWPVERLLASHGLFHGVCYWKLFQSTDCSLVDLELCLYL